MRAAIFIFCVFFVFFSCGMDNKQIFIDDSGVIIVPINMNGIPSLTDLANVNENSDLSFLNKYSINITELADSVSFVKLEITDDCLIASIKKIFFIEDRFFIHESKTSSILVFDKSGKFLYRVGRLGNGPGEYNRISSFLCDEKNNRLMIYDVVSLKMIYYSLEGQLIKVIPQFSDGFVVRDVINLPDGRFLCYKSDIEGKYPDGVWEVDSLGKIGKYYFKQDKQYPHYNQSNYFYKLEGGNVGLWRADYNDIYHFSDTTAHKYMSLIPNKQTAVDFPNETIKTHPSVIRKKNLREKGNYLFVEWIGGIDTEFRCTNIYFKNDNELFTGFAINYSNNEIGIIGGGDIVDFNIHDQLMSVIYADEVDYLMESKYLSNESRKNLSELNIDKEDNPVLEIIYLK